MFMEWLFLLTTLSQTLIKQSFGPFGDFHAFMWVETSPQKSVGCWMFVSSDTHRCYNAIGEAQQKQ